MVVERGVRNMTVEHTNVSYYMNDDFYSELLNGLKDWDSDVGKAEEQTHREVEKLLFYEARLLDEGKLEEWFDLFHSQCLYWIPITPGGGNPKKEVSIAFDDRRRLEDRIYRLRTGYAWSQIPTSRTIRMLSNLEVWHGENSLRARVNFMLSEYRSGRQKTYGGWCGYRLKREENTWKIAVKQINLLDSDQGHENLTFVL